MLLLMSIFMEFRIRFLGWGAVEFPGCGWEEIGPGGGIVPGGGGMLVFPGGGAEAGAVGGIAGLTATRAFTE